MRVPPPINCQRCPAWLENIFHALPTSEVESFSRAKVIRHYKRGQALYVESSRPEGLYCICEGQVKQVRSGPDGREQILRISRRGEVLGFCGLFAEESYTTSAFALDDSLVCFIRGSVFFPLVKNKPDLAVEVIKRLSREALVLEGRTAEMALKPADQRLAALLLRLEEFSVPRRVQGPTRLGVSLSRKEMAESIGTTAETLIRILGRLEADGLVRLSGKDIVILDVAGLRDISRSSLS